MIRSVIVRVWIWPPSIRLQRLYSDLLRRIRGKRHVISVYLQIDDPYSYLLSRALLDLQNTYDVDLQIRLSEALPGDYQAAPGLAAEYAVTDCRRLSTLLAVPFLDKGRYPPTEHRGALADAVAQVEPAEDLLHEIIRVLEIYWRGDNEGAARYTSAVRKTESSRKVIDASQAELRRRGHYASAMLYYAGEWYWGIDRLSYLTSRLEKRGLRSAERCQSMLSAIHQVHQVVLPARPPKAAATLPSMELFFSFRSPYSYVALQRAYALADAYDVELVLRPVLPMVERGMTVPPAKVRYVVWDAARIAQEMGIPFGKIADPLGKGVTRAMAIGYLALAQDKGRPFFLNATRAIWADATILATDRGLQKVVAKSGLDWQSARAALEDESWRRAAEKNREALENCGCWGVPTFKLGDYVTWGQDRIWLLAQHMEAHCESGDGILV